MPTNVSVLKKYLPDQVIDSLLKQGITTLNPLQETVFKKGIPINNILISSPTASGKTLIAEIICLNNIIKNQKKAIYVAPMKALVMEKYNDFKKTYPYLKSIVSIGDLDNKNEYLSNFDIIFVSTEKLDSLIRHNIKWLNKVGCIIFDEIHLIDDLSRGVTLELLITKLKSKNLQIIGLSATIGNDEELSKWINAEIFKSNYRPTKLRKGVLFDSKIYYELKSKKTNLNSKNPDSLLALADDSLSKNKQILIFYSTKKNTENEANKLSKFISKKLNNEEKQKLIKISNKILKVLETPTLQCIKISNLVKDGVAFHHSGLLSKQRTYIEEAFKNNLIKIICSTTTLSLGINLPAHTVLVKNIYRFNNYSSNLINTNEVLQLFGRAGRPKYDKEGIGLIFLNSKKDFEKVFKKYINAKPEDIYSKLAIAPLLRSHILAFISQNFLNSLKDIENFISQTFYGFQYHNADKIKIIIINILKELNFWKFIEIEDENFNDIDTKFKATRLGKRISELYIDPLSANWIVNVLKDISKLNNINVKSINYTKIDYELVILYLISNTQELKPYNKIIKESNFLFPIYKDIGIDFYNENEFNFNYALNAFTTSLMLKNWIEELSDNNIITKYSITPGFLYAKLLNADWILYSIIEISKILHIPINKFIEIRIRLKYGIKAELLNLTRLDYIGRVRARLLFKNEIKTISDVKQNEEKLISLLGNDISHKILSQINFENNINSK